MRLTRRGAVVAAVVVFALLQGYLFGERALNYVAAPGFAALIVGTLLLWRAEEPTIERSTIRPGFPGDERHETITVSGSGIATVVDTLPRGLEGDATERTVSLPSRLDRRVVFRERGTYALGPATVHQRDPLGLVATTVEFDDRSEITVYPEIHELDRDRVLGAVLGSERNTESQSFGWLREYQATDPLRRIHWKHTAKHDELLVVESPPSQRIEPIGIVVDGRMEMADDLATAAASIAFLLLDEGHEVSLTLPGVRVPYGHGDQHRMDVLGVLAGTGEHSSRGDAASRYHLGQDIHDAADVAIIGEPETVTVRLGDESSSFDQLRSGRSSTPAKSRTGSATAMTRTVIDE